MEGRPVPPEHTWEALASPLYCSSVVHIPGDIKDPSTLSKLSKFNGFLMFVHHDIHEVMDPVYTRAMQSELDQTPAESLPEKLDSMMHREYARFNLPLD